MKNLEKYEYGFQDPVLENEVSENLNRVSNEAKQDAIFAAKKGTPMKAIIFSIWSQTKAIAAIANKRLEPEISKLHAQIRDCDIGEIKKVAAIKQRELGNQILNANREINKHPEEETEINNPDRNYGTLICLGTDAILNFPTWQVVCHNLFISILAALFTAIGLAIGIRHFSIRTVGAKTKNEKMFWIAICLLCGAIVFLVLGFMRKEYYADDNAIFNSPFIWMLWNMVFYTIAFVLALNNTTGKEQKIAIQNFNERVKERDELVAQSKAINDDVIQKESLLNNCNEKLSILTKYLEKLLHQIEMERNAICANCINEYELQGGTISFSQIINDLKKQPL